MPPRTRTPFSSCRLVTLAAALALYLATGCTLSPDQDAVQVGESTAPIVGGTPTTGYPAVPLLYAEFGPNDPVQICSGTLITPRVVLTAAHCVDFPDGAPTRYLAYFGSNVLTDSDPAFRGTVDITEYLPHPAWNIDELEAGNDIGLALLQGRAPVEPMGVGRGSIDGLIGDQVHLVGWGRTTGDSDDFGVKREAMTSLLGAQPNLMQYGSASVNTCQGDSGGPNFMTEGGVEVIAGITSFGTEGCDRFGFGTRVDVFVASFIEPYIAQKDPTANTGSGQGGGNGSGTGTGTGADEEPEPVGGGCSAGGPGGSGTYGGVGFFTLLGLGAICLGLRSRRRRSG